MFGEILGCSHLEQLPVPFYLCSIPTASTVSTHLLMDIYFPFTVSWAISEVTHNDPYLLILTPLCHLLPLCVLARLSDLSLTNRICQNWW